VENAAQNLLNIFVERVEINFANGGITALFWSLEGNLNPSRILFFF